MNNLDSLKQKLDAGYNWPMEYLFKFIVPARMDSIARVEALFQEHATVYRKESRNGKYISISASQTMQSSNEVIHVYKKAMHIENILAL